MRFNIFSDEIRKTPYFVCRKRLNHTLTSHKKIDFEYEFTGLANPYEPLIRVFMKLTFPTKYLATQELINFMLTAVKVYKQYNLQNSLLQQFFPFPLSQKNSNYRQFMPLITTMKKMLQSSQATNNKTFRANSNYPSMMSVLCDQFRLAPDDQQMFQLLKTTLENNLAKYSIIPRSIKLLRVKALAQALESQFETKIIEGRKALFLKTKGTLLQIDQIVPFQFLIDSPFMISQINDQQVSDGCRHLLEELAYFHKRTQDFYLEKKAEIQRIRGLPQVRPQKVQKLNKFQNKGQTQLNQSYLQLTPQNVVFYLERLRFQEGGKNQDFITTIRRMKSQNKSLQKNQAQNLYKVTPDFCSIDLSIVFLQELGIKFGLPGEKRKSGPISIKDLLNFYSPLCILRNFDFRDQIQQLQRTGNLKNIREKEVPSILSWLLIVSTLDKLFLQHQKTSIYQQKLSSKQVIELITNKDPILGSKVPSLLLLYEMQQQQPLQICQFQFSTWKNLIIQIEKQQQRDYYQKHKYDTAKLLLQTMDNFYFGPQNFKHKVQKTSFYRNQPNILRYLILLLASKYIQVTFQKQILMMYDQQVSDIKQEDFGFKKIIEKFESIHNKVEDKIKSDYGRRPNKEDPCKKYLENPIFAKGGLYERLISMKFGTLCKLDKFTKKAQLKRRDQIEAVRQQIILQIRQKFIEKNMKQIRQLPSEQQFIVKKNCLLVEALFVLNPHNYCEIKGIEAQIQKIKDHYFNQSFGAPSQFDKFFNQTMQTIKSLGPKQVRT